MNDERLHRLLARSGDTGRAESQARALAVIEQAFRDRQRPSIVARLRPFPKVAVAIAAAGLVLALAFSAPGNAVADWIHDQIAGKPGAKNAAPALTHLPGGGRLLIHSPAGVWVVQADGSRRLIGPYQGASWSPRGLFVAVWRRHELLAVEPGGRVHWSLARAGSVRGARWAPDGYRVAYLAGTSVRVVAGDGTGDRLLSRGVAAVTPEWRPSAPHLLAYAPRSNNVELASTDLHARVWGARVHDSVRALAWRSDGQVLAAAGRRGVWLLDGSSGRVLRRLPIPAGAHIASMAFAPTGSRLAVAVNGVRAHVLTVDAARFTTPLRPLFSGAGRFTDVAWSPDGRWILITWPAADQWLYIRSTDVAGLTAVRAIARQFDPQARAPRFPSVGGWCCGG
jgi:dipeptidyl aminopeptidase/acylaminoacyl peptidase